MERPVTVLAADDDPEGLATLGDALRAAGYEVVTAASGPAAVAAARDAAPDVILLDVVMPGLSGYEVTERLKADPELRYTPVLLLTGKDGYDEIIHGLDRGADGYVTKPYRLAELLARVKAALRTRALYRELSDVTARSDDLKKRLAAALGPSDMVGATAAMREVFSLVAKVAPSLLPVLVTGESGTGKELVAGALHSGSDRASGPFVVLNCAALADGLLESELFGHVRGAFTGAVKDKIGLFRAADGGTLFLDEVGEMSLPLQAKLLRVLQDNTFTPVGDTRPQKSDVRVVAATHRDLKEMSARGTFREDLYYRLAVVTVRVPPLRERREDVPLLVEHFLRRRTGRGAELLHGDTLRALCDHDWPGNVRQLGHEVERLLVLGRGQTVLTPDLLSPEVASPRAAAPPGERGEGGPGAGATLPEQVEALERRAIEEALARHGGNKTAAAKELGIARSNLIEKSKRYSA